MASEHRANRYRTYGNVAYQSAYKDNAVRQEPRRSQEQPRRRPQVQPRERVAARPQIEVRCQSAVSPFAIVGFAAVILCAFLLISSGARLAMVADQTFDLQSELTTLRAEEKKLQAQYEQAYDLAQIEKEMTANASMVKASSANTVYLELSKPDSVVYYAQASRGVSGLADRLEQFFRDLLS